MMGAFPWSFSALMNRRTILQLGASTVGVLVLPWLGLTREQDLWLLNRSTYWILLLQLGLFALSLAKAARVPSNEMIDRRNWSLFSLAGILVLGFVLLAQQPLGFRSLDEVRGVGASQSMFLDQLAGVAAKGVNSGVTFQLTGERIAEFPMLQPFLVSLMHSFTGYRPENAMLLNSILIFALLGLAWEFGCRIGGRCSGALMVAMLASVPLLARSATGGGRGILGALLSLVLMHLALRSVEPGGRAFLPALMIGGALLLAGLEPAPGTLLALIAVAYLAWRRDAQGLPAWVAWLPLLFIPAVLRMRAIDPAPFAAVQWTASAIRTCAGLLDTSRMGTQSVAVSCLGLLALPFFALRAKRGLGTQVSAQPGRLVLPIFALGFLLDALVAFGSGTAIVNGRLDPDFGLRLALGLSVAVVSVASGLELKPWMGRSVITALAAAFFMYSLPAMSRRSYTIDSHEAPELAWRRAFMASHALSGTLVLDRDPVIWTVHRVTAMTTREVAAKPGAIPDFLASRKYDSILVCQRLEVDPRTGTRVLPPGESIEGGHRLEPISEMRITPLTTLRMSRILPAGAGLPEPSEPVRDPLEGIQPGQRNAAVNGFLGRYLRQLP